MIYHWTNHARGKMKFYHLSEQRVKRVLNSPKRIEEGIAPNTVAMMQPADSKKHPYEIWVMIQKPRINRGSRNQRALRGSLAAQRKSAIIKIISAWKYPGKTKPRGEIALNFLRREYSEYIKES